MRPATRHTPAILAPFLTRAAAVAAVATVAGSLAAYGGGDTHRDAPGSPAASGAVSRAASGADLTGAGSTFAYPLWSKWGSAYAAKTGVRVNYQSIGSGGGIRQLSEQTVDFGGTDAPMTDAELAKAKGGPVMHVPVAMGADVVVYNVPGVTQPLHVTGPLLADVFLGKVTKWNAAPLAALNPGVRLPDTDILVVHRSDGSGTTYVWTDYLSHVSPAWQQQVGTGKDVKWPVGLGGKGNEGVAGQVKQTPGAIGSVELAYAVQNKSPIGLVQNAAGQYVAPAVASIMAAAAGVAKSLSPASDYRIFLLLGMAE